MCMYLNFTIIKCDLFFNPHNHHLHTVIHKSTRTWVEYWLFSYSYISQSLNMISFLIHITIIFILWYIHYYESTRKWVEYWLFSYVYLNYNSQSLNVIFFIHITLIFILWYIHYCESIRKWVKYWLLVMCILITIHNH